MESSMHRSKLIVVGVSVALAGTDGATARSLDNITVDEENSGVIEVTDIVKNANWYEAGRRYYLGNMQAHYAIPGELVEGGQLYLMASPKVASPKKQGKPR
jgi:hypothetical protein